MSTKISCEMAADLLPLYLEDSCSEDSRAALEEHLKNCPSCRAKLERMRSTLPGDLSVENPAPDLSAYAKKVRGHRLRITALALVSVLVLSLLGGILFLTVQRMMQQSSPTVYEVEPGTINLTEGAFRANAEDIGQYVFYTNFQQIKVEVQGSGGDQGTVYLYNTENPDSFIQVLHINKGKWDGTFTGLSAQWRYRITCEGLDGAVITVSEGRATGFFENMKAVLAEIMEMFGGKWDDVQVIHYRRD